METIDDETTKACEDFITKQAKAGTPFFAWMNFTRMHVFTHVRPEYEGKAGMGKGYFYADGMWEMDQNVGKLLDRLTTLSRGQHHCRLHYGQRTECVYLARCSRSLRSAARRTPTGKALFVYRP